MEWNKGFSQDKNLTPHLLSLNIPFVTYRKGVNTPKGCAFWQARERCASPWDAPFPALHPDKYTLMRTVTLQKQFGAAEFHCRLQAETEASISCLPTKTPRSASKKPHSAAAQDWPLPLGLWAAVTRKSAFSNAMPGQLLKWQCCGSSLIRYLFLTQHPHPFFSSPCLVLWFQRVGERLREEGEF